MSSDKIWQENNNTAKIGEQLFYDFMESSGYKCIDVSADDFFFEFDIDFILSNSNGSVFKCEVKTDNRIWDTGNMFIERYCNKDTLQKGWYHTSKADTLVYIDVHNQIIYIFKFSYLRDYMAEEDYNFRTATVSDKEDRFGDVHYIKREGYLVNMNKFLRWLESNEYKYIKKEV